MHISELLKQRIGQSITSITTINSADANEQRRGRMVIIMALGMLCATVLGFPTAFIQPNVGQELVTFGSGGLIFLLICRLARRGHVTTGAILLIITISLGVFSLTLANGNLITTPYFLAVSVLVAGLVLRPRYIWLVVLANFVGFCLTILFVPTIQIYDPITQLVLIDHVLIMLIIALTGFLGSITVQQALNVAQRSQEDAEATSAVLEQRVVERTAILQEREARYRDIAELTSDFVYTSTSGADGIPRLNWVSESVFRVTGYHLQEIELPTLWLTLLHAEDRAALIAQSQRVQQGQESISELRIITKQGAIRWLRNYIRPQWDTTGTRVIGALGAAQDTTERKQAEEALRRSEATKSALLAAIPDLMFHIHKDGTILAVQSDNAGDLLVPTANTLGQPLRAVAPPELAEQTLRIVHQALQTRTVQHYEYQLTMGDTLRECEARAVAIGDDEVLVLVRDVTARKHAEVARLEMERSLLQTQKLESLGVLAGGIAHDFNNLLTGILGNVQLLLIDVAHQPALRESVAQIEVSARRAAELTQQILAYAGKGRFVVEPVSLNRLITEMPQLLEALLPKTVSLHLHLAPDLLAMDADATQLRQVVLNLLINAGEAMTFGGVINCSTSVRSFDSPTLANTYRAPDLPAGAYVVLEVHDSGSGMDPITLARIFDPFFTTKFTGRGLGLAAVLGIVRGHHGAIRVQSAVGIGTTFSILFPPSAARAPVVATLPPPSPLARGQGTVLVVDDEPAIRVVAQRILERQGFSVLTAVDGQDGVDVLQANADAVVCVLLDLTMPRLEGPQALAAMRQIRPAVPIIIMSGYSAENVSQQFPNVTALRCLQKPFTMNDMWERLRQVGVV
ncbi:MAG: response regulator [Chloroflexales bacterium]|nr:response regulator [Chloroflexales bacterium]